MPFFTECAVECMDFIARSSTTGPIALNSWNHFVGWWTSKRNWNLVLTKIDVYSLSDEACLLFFLVFEASDRSEAAGRVLASKRYGFSYVAAITFMGERNSRQSMQKRSLVKFSVGKENVLSLFCRVPTYGSRNTCFKHFIRSCLFIFTTKKIFLFIKVYSW